jgi:hypothetical protein
MMGWRIHRRANTLSAIMSGSYMGNVSTMTMDDLGAYMGRSFFAWRCCWRRSGLNEAYLTQEKRDLIPARLLVLFYAGSITMHLVFRDGVTIAQVYANLEIRFESWRGLDRTLFLGARSDAILQVKLLPLKA